MVSRPEAAEPRVESGSATEPETRGIEFVRDQDRRGRPRDLFAVWAAPSVSVLNLTVGATLIVLGLELWQAVLVVLAASSLWILTGIVATSGPAAGTAGTVITRALFGVVGNKVIVAFSGWLISAVYLALNWVASAFIGAELLARFGFDDPTLAPIVVTLGVACVTIVVAVYGHGLILRSYGVISTVLVAVFLIVTAFIMPTVDWGYRAAEPLSGVALWSAVTIGFTILASSPLSFTNSPDMARYLPRETKPWRVVAATALGGALPSAFFAIVGALLATGIGVAEVAGGMEGALLDTLPVWLVPLFVIGVILNTIALNGMTTYTASMALQAIGIPIRRIPAAVVVGVIGAALTVYFVLAGSLLDAVNLMLQLLVVVAAPFMAVFATDVLLRRGRYDALDLFDERRGGPFWFAGGWKPAGMIAIVVGGFASAMCVVTSLWVGPVAAAFGHVDLSVPAGAITGSALYAILTRAARRRPTNTSAPARLKELA
nr:cytosine permease [Microbacterium sp. G2-8]